MKDDYTISHKPPHVWYGNLVTMSWWDDLWLSKGFAFFLKRKVTEDAILPGWQDTDLFLVEQMHSALATDQELSSHPVVQTVNNIDKNDGEFHKTNNFRKEKLLRAKETYVQKSEVPYLIKIFQECSPDNLNVTAITDTWTRQKGFPLVNVKKSVVIEFDDPVEWIKFNAHEIGYYRVNYEEREWNALYNILRCQHETLSAFDRAHLLEDAFSLAYAGQLDYILIMNMMKYLKREKHPIPWCVASANLMNIFILLKDGSIFPKAFMKYARDLVDSTYREIGWELKEVTDAKSKGYTDIRLRKTILEFALVVEHVDCSVAAKRIFVKYFCGADEEDRREQIPANPHIRDLFSYYGMHYLGDMSVWELIFKLFIAENDRMEKLMLMRTLIAIKDASILEQFIVTATDEKYVSAQDFLSCLIAMSENPVGTPIVWEWVRSNWEFLVDRYTLNDRHLGSLILSITKTFATKTRLDEMECFFAKYPDAGAGAMNRAKALETVSNNIKWRARTCKKLGMWLLRYRIEERRRSI